MSKLTTRARQWLARYETDPEVKQLLIEGLARCETDPEVKQLLIEGLARCETDPEVKQLLTRALVEYEAGLSEIKQSLTQVLAKCETEPQEVKQLLAQVRESCSEILYNLHRAPQTIYAAKETYEIHRRRKFIKDKAGLNLRRNYVELLRGLDSESIHTVNTILARTEALSTTDKAELGLFNEDEQRQIRTLQTEFWAKILQLDECCFAYMDYLLPVNHFEPSVFFYRHELHHLTAPERVGDKAIIDIGGFIGDSALVFAKEFKGQIYSFEPMAENYKYMLQTIALNNLSGRIMPFNVGIADTARQALIYPAGSASSEYPVRDVKEEPETVDTISLDSYVNRYNIEVGLIKADIEGAEQEMLGGAENTIRTQKPALIISIYHSAYDFFQIKPMLESWDLGYKFKIRRPVDGYIMGETVLLAEAE